MKYIFTESQISNIKSKNLIKENDEFKNFPISPASMRKLINSQYEPCFSGEYKFGCLGKIETKKCTTDYGVLGGDYSEKKYGGESNWSIINKFDTNTNVQKEIIKIYEDEMMDLEEKKDFKEWVISKAVDLFSNDGMYTERLVDENMKTIVFYIY